MSASSRDTSDNEPLLGKAVNFREIDGAACVLLTDFASSIKFADEPAGDYLAAC
jgi:hypothetical protein